MTNQIQALLTEARASGRNDKYRVRLTGLEREYWMSTNISRLGGYGFRGTITAGDKCNQKGGEMGAGYVNLQGKSKRQQRKVGCEEERSSSNRPKLAAFVLALRSTPVTTPMLSFCDNQALLKAGKRRVGEGGKAALVGAPDAHILLEAIEELRKRRTAGAVTFPSLVKVIEELRKRRTAGADRANQQVLEGLRAAVATVVQYDEWDLALPHITFGLNSHISAATGVSPLSFPSGFCLGCP